MTTAIDNSERSVPPGGVKAQFHIKRLIDVRE